MCNPRPIRFLFLIVPQRGTWLFHIYKHYGKRRSIKTDVDRDFIPTMRGSELLIRKLSRYPGNTRAVIEEITTFRDRTFNPLLCKLTAFNGLKRSLLLPLRSSRNYSRWNIITRLLKLSAFLSLCLSLSLSPSKIETSCLIMNNEAVELRVKRAFRILPVKIWRATRARQREYKLRPFERSVNRN